MNQFERGALVHYQHRSLRGPDTAGAEVNCRHDPKTGPVLPEPETAILLLVLVRRSVAEVTLGLVSAGILRGAIAARNTLDAH